MTPAPSDDRLRELHALREVSRSYPIGARVMQEHRNGGWVTIADYNKAVDTLLPYAEELLRIASDLGELGDPFAAWEHAASELLSRRSSQASEGDGQHKWVKSNLGHGETMCEYCRITNREAAVLGELNACSKAPASPSKRVERLETALKPFSDYAGELFARNWNASVVVLALDNPDDPHRVTGADFFAARQALGDRS